MFKQEKTYIFEGDVLTSTTLPVNRPGERAVMCLPILVGSVLSGTKHVHAPTTVSICCTTSPHVALCETEIGAHNI